MIRENESSCYFLNSVGDLFLYFIAYFLMKMFLIAIVRLFFRNILSKVKQEEQLKLEKEQQDSLDKSVTEK